MSQNTFNNIMYTIVTLGLIAMFALGIKPAIHQWYYENYIVPNQHHQVQQVDTSYMSFQDFNH